MKQLKLLIVANNNKWASWDLKIKEMKEWFSPKVDLLIDLTHTQFKNIPYTQYSSVDNPTEKGFDGVDPWWYDVNVTPLAKGYDMVLFVIPVKEWPITNKARGWRTDKDQGPVQLQISSDENEHIYLSPNSQDIGTTFFQYGRHEILHALFMITGQEDTVHYWWNQSPNLLSECLKQVNFTETKTGELDQAGLKDLLTSAYNWLTKVLEWSKGDLLKPIPDLPKELMNTQKRDLLKEFCLAIQEYEGYFAPNENKLYPNGTRAWKNKNPGNLRYVGQKLAVGKDKDNFCIFNTYEDGFATLKAMVERVAKGLSKVYRADMTIVEFVKVYAPSTDGNYPEKYAQFIGRKLGIGTDTKINQLI